MKVMHYNIMDGCPDKDRRSRLKSWIQEQKCDVISFNELNGWDQETFQNEMKALGLDYSILFEMTTSPYFVGIASKYPITVIEQIEKDPIYHGLLHVEIKGIRFVVAHLTPFESKKRERETAFIADVIQHIDGPAVVMGDLNTLSPLDRVQYEKNNVIKYLKENNILNRQHLLEGEINYKPMELLLGAGLRDTRTSKEFQHTFPTPYIEMQQNGAQLRIDYLLANNAMYEKLIDFDIVQTKTTRTLSDHYPIQSVWNI
ncbi:hypothetical protein JNUCC1_00796 [Lentibacillus sp. JNUCC-1]|uniref:endonuclease/exonuclease/phosphatase family protein n=1 Tax=Lentibacillus sp. JNUCC-1 TaxID=2654513 RepID=UPI0012E8FF6B|nr:endonuclease/exonuclease/phosphatase family protein [Lentibacillus sp. JNUCC-1]MUV36990.1 hypothetical protein [Lentibacillus sp. JNUCC-1]